MSQVNQSTTQGINRPLTISNSYLITDLRAHRQKFGEHVPILIFGRSINESRERTLSLDEAEEIIYGIGVNSFNRIEAILEVLDRIDLTDGQHIRFLKEHLPSTDGVYNFGPSILWKIGILAAISGADFHEFLTLDEERWVKSLGEEFTVYRGCDESEVDGICWSTSKTEAEKFAAGFRGYRHPNPVLASATCNINQVSLVTNSREEFEIIVDPYQFDEINVTRLS